MRTLSFIAIAAAACLLNLPGNASAEQITWGAGVDLFGGGDTETFVNNNGTGIVAINSTSTGAPVDATVNGVTFAGAGGAAMAGGITQNGVTFTTSTSPGDNQGALGNGSFTNAEVVNLLAGQVFNLNGSTATFSGLTTGSTYEIQIFGNDSRGTRATGVFAMFSDGVNDLATSFTNGTAGLAELNNSVDDIVSANPVGDNSGDSITGSFVADGTGSQSFIIGGSNNNFANEADGFINQGSPSAFNAIQLREVAAVPEPGSLMMIGLGSLALVSRRRRS